MMSRFTERAQEALQNAQRLMFAKQHTQLDVEHVFLALLQQRNSLPAQIITRLGGDPQALIHHLDNILNNIQTVPIGRHSSTGYITQRCNQALQGAAEEADRLSDQFISTEHLFLSIVREHGGTSAKLLKDADIDYGRVEAALAEVRDSRPDEFVSVTRPPAHRQVGREIVTPQSLANPTGFSHGVVTSGGRLLFLAGQTAIDAEGDIVAPGDIVGQYRQVLANLKAVVEEAGGEMEDIVKMTIFVGDRDNYIENLKPLGRAHKDFFGDYYPATALLEISRFFQDGVMVEIEGIAVLPN